MFRLFVNNSEKKAANDSSLLYMIQRIKDGDTNLKEQFINDNVPYIIKSVSNVLGMAVDVKNSEEYSVGLSAFNEAIDSYDIKRNDNFYRYSYLVIKSRLIDYIRKNKKHKKVLPFSSFGEYSNVEKNLYDYDYHAQFEKTELRDEFQIFKKNLEAFGISIGDLLLCSPKHKDSRLTAIKIAGILAENSELFNKMMKKKQLPLKDLLEHIDFSDKTVERNRKFIIAVSLILRSDLEDLKLFVTGFERGCKYE